MSKSQKNISEIFIKVWLLKKVQQNIEEEKSRRIYCSQGLTRWLFLAVKGNYLKCAFEVMELKNVDKIFAMSIRESLIKRCGHQIVQRHIFELLTHIFTN